MKLYVANCTKQIHDFGYRVPGDGRLRIQSIPMGGQIVVLRPDASPEDLKGIVDQHLQYGIVAATDIDRTRDFIGICYSYDKPISVEKIMNAHAHNEDILIERGVEYRRNNAAAIGNNINNAGEGQSERVQSLEVGIVELGRDAKFNETIEVVRPGQEPRNGRPASEVQTPKRRGRR